MENFAASVRQAEVALRDLFEPTPLQKNDHLSAKYGAEIWLKREDLTPVRSYKLRGAFNAMRKVVARGGAAHFVCASAGNDAQAKDRQDAHVRRRRGQHRADRRLFRPDAGCLTGIRPGRRRGVPVAL
jgi:threonine synthase